MWILDPEGLFWQRFIFENLYGLCLYYGQLHPSEGVCLVGKGGATMVEGGCAPASSEVLAEVVGSPCLGP